MDARLEGLESLFGGYFAAPAPGKGAAGREDAPLRPRIRSRRDFRRHAAARHGLDGRDEGEGSASAAAAAAANQQEESIHAPPIEGRLRTAGAATAREAAKSRKGTRRAKRSRMGSRKRPQTEAGRVDDVNPFFDLQKVRAEELLRPKTFVGVPQQQAISRRPKTALGELPLPVLDESCGATRGWLFVQGKYAHNVVDRAEVLPSLQWKQVYVVADPASHALIQMTHPGLKFASLVMPMAGATVLTQGLRSFQDTKMHTFRIVAPTGVPGKTCAVTFGCQGERKALRWMKVLRKTAGLPSPRPLTSSASMDSAWEMARERRLATPGPAMTEHPAADFEQARRLQLFDGNLVEEEIKRYGLALKVDSKTQERHVVLLETVAIEKIQSFWRAMACKEIVFGEQGLLAKKKAAIEIQGFLRKRQARRLMLSLRARHFAAITIQCASRCSHARQARALLEKRHTGAVRIQRAFRCFQARNLVRRLEEIRRRIVAECVSETLLTVTRSCTCYSELLLKLERRVAALRLQSFSRKILARMEFVRRQHALCARKLQGIARGKQQRNRFLAKKLACVTIQRLVRGWQGRRSAGKTRVARDAAVKIQAFGREVVCRNSYLEATTAAETLQNFARFILAIKALNIAKRYRALQHVQATRVQRAFRRHVSRGHFRQSLRLHLAAREIQNWFRRERSVWVWRSTSEAIAVIQRFWRCIEAKDFAQLLRKDRELRAASCIQRNFREWKFWKILLEDKERLGAKLTTVGQSLHRSAHWLGSEKAQAFVKLQVGSEAADLQAKVTLGKRGSLESYTVDVGNWVVVGTFEKLLREKTCTELPDLLHQLARMSAECAARHGSAATVLLDSTELRRISAAPVLSRTLASVLLLHQVFGAFAPLEGHASLETATTVLRRVADAPVRDYRKLLEGPLGNPDACAGQICVSRILDALGNQTDRFKLVKERLDRLEQVRASVKGRRASHDAPSLRMTSSVHPSKLFEFNLDKFQRTTWPAALSAEERIAGKENQLCSGSSELMVTSTFDRPMEEIRQVLASASAERSELVEDAQRWSLSVQDLKDKAKACDPLERSLITMIQHEITFLETKIAATQPVMEMHLEVLEEFSTLLSRFQDLRSKVTAAASHIHDLAQFGARRRALRLTQTQAALRRAVPLHDKCVRSIGSLIGSVVTKNAKLKVRCNKELEKYLHPLHRSLQDLDAMASKAAAQRHWQERAVDTVSATLLHTLQGARAEQTRLETALTAREERGSVVREEALSAIHEATKVLARKKRVFEREMAIEDEMKRIIERDLAEECLQAEYERVNRAPTAEEKLDRLLPELRRFVPSRLRRRVKFLSRVVDRTASMEQLTTFEAQQISIALGQVRHLVEAVRDFDFSRAAAQAFELSKRLRTCSFLLDDLQKIYEAKVHRNVRFWSRGDDEEDDEVEEGRGGEGDLVDDFFLLIESDQVVNLNKMARRTAMEVERVAELCDECDTHWKAVLAELSEDEDDKDDDHHNDSDDPEGLEDANTDEVPKKRTRLKSKLARWTPRRLINRAYLVSLNKKDKAVRKYLVPARKLANDPLGWKAAREREAAIEVQRIFRGWRARRKIRNAAAIRIQNLFRNFRARKFFVEVLYTAVEKFYDVQSCRYYYTWCGRVSWSPPAPIANRYIRYGRRVKRPRGYLWPKDEAVTCMQATFRGWLQRKAYEELVVESFEKVWEPSRERYFYQSKKTGRCQWFKPLGLGKRDIVPSIPGPFEE